MNERVIIFRGWSREAVLYHMQKYSLRPPTGLRVIKGSPIKVGTPIDLPTEAEGIVALTRRHVFWFWRKEYLIERITKDGIFYTWFPQSKVVMT